MRSFRVSSVVRAAPEAVWERATTIAGVNAEPFRWRHRRLRKMWR